MFALGLDKVSITIPTAIQSGGSAILLCEYELGDDNLYTVKWYKGRREFYRYTAKEIPPIKVFSPSGFYVDIESSNASQIVLHKLDISATSKYMCEVSADAPSFQTHMRSGDLNVYIPPSEKPKITGLKATYRSGEYVRANCTNNLSFPAANLQWKINGFPVYPGESISYEVIKTTIGEGKQQQILESSILGLQFLLSHEHFNEVGKIKVQCIATLFDGIYEADTIQYIEAIDPNFNDDDNDVHYSFIHDKNGGDSSLVQSSGKLFLLLVCNLVIGLLLSSTSNCNSSSIIHRRRRRNSRSCSESSCRSNSSRNESNKMSMKMGKSNISGINNQSASLIGLDDPLTLLYLQQHNHLHHHNNEIREEIEIRKHDNATTTVFKQFKAFS
uniref:CSON013364 protein n=1 Tax=Culicoides sonorensis TaxID=179676 RepID=A0A336KPD9_CULSO